MTLHSHERRRGSQATVARAFEERILGVAHEARRRHRARLRLAASRVAPGVPRGRGRLRRRRLGLRQPGRLRAGLSLPGREPRRCAPARRRDPIAARRGLHVQRCDSARGARPVSLHAGRRHRDPEHARLPVRLRNRRRPGRGLLFRARGRRRASGSNRPSKRQEGRNGRDGAHPHQRSVARRGRHVPVLGWVQPRVRNGDSIGSPRQADRPCSSPA